MRKTKAKENKPESEDKFIKIPWDFTSLLDLKELVENYEFTTKLSNALKDYQTHYVKSFLMTRDEVLEYVPIADHNLYKVRQEDEVYKISKDLPTLTHLIDDIEKNKKIKAFMVDPDAKEIVYCPWGSYENNYNKHDKNIEYKGFDFTIENKILTVHVNYSFGDSRHIGGSWINTYGGNGYWRGGKEEYYIRKGYEIHQYCTNTNRYLGYKGMKCDKKRERISSSSMW